MSEQSLLHSKLLQIGQTLSQPSPSTDDLCKALEESASVFSEIPQSPSSDILEIMKHSVEILAKPEFLNHNDREVLLLVATCISEIMRVVAPNPPYSDEVLREVFKLIVTTFQELDEVEAPSFARKVNILEMVSKVRSCVVMLDLQFDDLILQMFQAFFHIASEKHPQKVLIAMRAIMTLVIQESDDVPQPLLEVILNNLVKKKEVSVAAHRLAMAVFQRCAKNLEPYVQQYLRHTSKDNAQQKRIREDSHELIYEIYRLAPSMVFGIIPNLIGELQVDDIAVRVKAVGLLGRLYALPGNWLLHDYRPLFFEFVKRFTDKAAEVRLAALDCAKSYLLAKPSGTDTEKLSTALRDSLQDHEMKVRTHAVLVISEIVKSSLKCVPMSLLKHATELLHDKEEYVRKATLQNLMDVYRSFCMTCFEGSAICHESLSWIPCKILKCSFDDNCQKLRPEAMELPFPEELFPSELSVADRVRHWISIFLACDKNDKAAFGQILSQKQRLQLEMQNYLSLREKIESQEADMDNDKDKLVNCYKNMLTAFPNPAKAEEGFQQLSQLKDNSIWKELALLLDPNTAHSEANTSRDELLRRLGSEHSIYEFVRILTAKCSYILFGKEHMKEVLDRLFLYKTAVKQELLEACSRLFTEFAVHFPVLLEGADEVLMQLLEEDNGHLKDGILQILAKSVCFTRGHFLESSGLILQNLCLEGSRRQAKYAVQALAARRDSGVKTLSQLYLNLVELLETTVHLPTVLQSLSWIAQCAMPVFETREDDIFDFVAQNLLRRDSVQEGDSLKWDSASKECCLKVYGLKTLIRCFLLNSHANRSERIKGLFSILVKVLTSGEISDDVKSSAVDKAHLRLAAAKGVLRLSKYWDAEISPSLFHSVVLISQDSCQHVQQAFLGKVHQYIKERLIPYKYACVFPLSISHASKELLPDVKRYMVDFIDSSHSEFASLPRPVNVGETLTTYYPEYIIFYFVHVLARQISFPATIGSGEIQELFTPVYRQFCFLLCLLLKQKGDDYLKSNGNASVIISIFDVLKGAEDSVDSSKSPNGHILAEIGILITKELLKIQTTSENSAGIIAPPSDLYIVPEDVNADMSKNDGSDLPAYLLEDNLLLQIEAFQEELHIMDTAGWEENAAGNHHSLNNAEKDSDELGIAAVSAGRSNHKKQNGKFSRSLESLPKGTDKLAAMALDQPVMSSSKKKRGHVSKEKDSFYSPEPKRKRSGEGPVLQSSEKRKRGRPKGSGKVSAHKSGKGVSPIGLRVYDEGMLDIPATPQKRTPVDTSTESPSKEKHTGDLSTKSVDYSGKKSRQNNEFFSDMLPQSPEDSIELEQTEMWQLKKTSNVKADKKLVGCRIKVWWPLDKEFYEGVVQAFDSLKRRHTVCYADGDIEFLNLSKEQWELVDEDDAYNEEESSDSPPASRTPVFQNLKGQKNDMPASTRTLKAQAKEHPQSSPNYRQKKSSSQYPMDVTSSRQKKSISDVKGGIAVFGSPILSSDSEPFDPSDSDDEVNYNVETKTQENVAGDHVEESNNTGSSGDKRF